MRAAAGLQIDVRNPEQTHASGAARGLHAHRLDQLRTRVELLVGDPDGLGVDGAGDQRIGLLLDARGVEQAHVDVEIEPGLVGRDVAAGDGRHDDAGHDVERGVQPHQRMAGDLEDQRFARGRLRRARRADVPHAGRIVALARVGDGDALAAVADQHAGVAHLAAALRIEDRAVELDAALVGGDDARLRGL